MSGVYIKGMEMPTSCFYCPMREWHIIHGEKIISCRVAKMLIKNEDERPSSCPIVPVPEHGRLIDADALMAYFENIADIEWNKKAAPISWSYAFENVMNDIENAPTIIPASKEGDG